ncbi:MAG: YMGG-like glycine zipper-containing protein [Pseudohaliea sp.]
MAGRKRAVVLAAGLVLAGCTTTKEIIIDEQGVDMARYRQDLAECRAYAEQVRTGEKTARGAASGAAIGGAIGAITGGSRESAARGAGVGAVSGAAKGASRGEQEAVRVVKQCLRGRGYRVLN